MVMPKSIAPWRVASLLWPHGCHLLVTFSGKLVNYNQIGQHGAKQLKKTENGPGRNQSISNESSEFQATYGDKELRVDIEELQGGDCRRIVVDFIQ